MTVEYSVSMNQQPADGGIEIHPLGGDGITSPSSIYHCRVASLGDASAGYNRIRLGLDPRFTQLVTLMTVEVTGVAADVNVDMKIVESVDSLLANRATLKYLPINSQTVDCRASWAPIPFLMATSSSDPTEYPHIQVVTDNVNLSRIRLYAHVYNFDRRARELTPIDILASCLARSESFTA